MADWILSLFSSNGFMPHGMCYLWQPGILTLHVLSDSLITLAYFSIPFTLLYFVRQRRDLQFNWMFVCFAVFIVACGATHALEILTIWHPVYWLSGGVKAITALASVPTAILLVRLIPDALRLPSPSALQRANTELALEVAERKRVEGEVRLANEALESRVAERTRELESAYQNLRQSQQAILQQERLRALGQMASGIAHDINNALTPATLYAQSLLERDDKLNDESGSERGGLDAGRRHPDPSFTGDSRARHGRSQRYRRRDGRGDSQSLPRAVLHHQRRARHRSGFGDGLRDDATAQCIHRGCQRARDRHHHEIDFPIRGRSRTQRRPPGSSSAP